MGLSVVQAKNSQVVGTAVTVTISTTKGNLLVVCAYQGANNTSTLSISDTAGNTWTQAGGYGSASAASRIAMFYVANAAAVTSVTATWSGSLSATIPCVVYEISGADPSSPFDTS